MAAFRRLVHTIRRCATADASDDDYMVVMASGDEMVLEFAIPERPLPEGWTRDYVLHSVGWDKDADLNTLEGQSSLPLPFAGMHSYPPSLEDEERAQKFGS